MISTVKRVTLLLDLANFSLQNLVNLKELRLNDNMIETIPEFLAVCKRYAYNTKDRSSYCLIGDVSELAAPPNDSLVQIVAFSNAV